MVRNDIECRKGSRKNLNKIALRILRIALVTVLVVGYLPVYFGFTTFVAEMFGDNGYMHLEEITKETYEQIAQAEGTEKPKVEYSIGDHVKINDGPFLSFEGDVEEIDTEKGKLKVIVSMFGRFTPVELEYWQVSRIEDSEKK